MGDLNSPARPGAGHRDRRRRRAGDHRLVPTGGDHALRGGPPPSRPPPPAPAGLVDGLLLPPIPQELPPQDTPEPRSCRSPAAWSGSHSPRGRRRGAVGTRGRRAGNESCAGAPDGRRRPPAMWRNGTRPRAPIRHTRRVGRSPDASTARSWLSTAADAACGGSNRLRGLRPWVIGLLRCPVNAPDGRRSFRSSGLGVPDTESTTTARRLSGRRSRRRARRHAGVGGWLPARAAQSAPCRGSGLR